MSAAPDICFGEVDVVVASPGIVVEVVAPACPQIALTAAAVVVVVEAGVQGGMGAPGRDGAGATEHAYAVAVARGQTSIPISPPPTDLNGFELTVNGIGYGPPNSITVSAVAVTWLGAFSLDASDDVRVRYL